MGDAGALARLRQRLPAVTQRRWNAGDSYHARAERWMAADHQVVRVTARLTDPMILGVDQAPHLDGLLCYAALQDGPDPKSPQPWVIPAPLWAADVSPDGLPLYAAGCLLPDTDAAIADGTDYWHQRQPPWELAKSPNARADTGRYAVLRRPVRTRHVARLSALAIGLPAEIERLLSTYVHGVGAKSAYGYGRVARWEVTPVSDLSPNAAWPLIQRQRPIPLAYYPEGTDMSAWHIAPSLGWTAPYWYRPWHQPCRADYRT